MSDGRSPTGLLAIDRVAIGYAAVTGALSLAGGLRGMAFAALHAFVIFLIVKMSRRPLPRGQLATFFRLLYPVIATPLLYHELSYLNQFVVTGYFDSIVLGWEVAVFRSQISQEAARWFPALWLSEFMTVGYLTYYFVIPLLAVGAWASAGKVAFHRLGVTVALAFAICYTWFILFPVMGPRYWYGALEGALSEGSIYQFTRDLLAGGSSKGTAFPSSHVAGTCAAWFAAAREDERGFFLAAVPVVTLTLSTVWGGFHYAIDAVAGLVIAWIAFAVAPRLAAWAPLPDYSSAPEAS
jgi:membrane-associated phospholipid phosphatase